jgi:hypothetical protein
VKVPYTLDGPYYAASVWHDLKAAFRAAVRTWRACRSLRRGAHIDETPF